MIRGTIPGGRFGRIVEAVGDMDGDGAPEFAVAAPGPYSSSNAALYVFSGAIFDATDTSSSVLFWDQWTTSTGHPQNLGTNAPLAPSSRPQIAVADSEWTSQTHAELGRVTILGLQGVETVLLSGLPVNRAHSGVDINGDGRADLLVSGAGPTYPLEGGVRLVLGGAGSTD